ncbi:MAG: glucosamine-6-phosphate deaminase [Clostridia bacterium]|nr:glucosamine-6-phosphate deaminase [Clostridia bacterium]
MKYIEVETYDKLSEIAKELVKYEINKNPNLVLGLATGSSPVGLYKKLIESFKNNELSFKNVKTFNLDEYCNLEKSDNQSYRYFMEENLFKHIDINSSNINFLNGICNDFEWECARYDKLLENTPIDLQILGIGVNGHIAFNEPDSHFTKGTHLVNLTEDTINANSRFFESKDQVPTQALSMGIRNIFNAKKIILLANGENKKDAVEKMLKGNITPYLPASILQLHPDCTVIYSKK